MSATEDPLLRRSIITDADQVCPRLLVRFEYPRMSKPRFDLTDKVGADGRLKSVTAAAMLR